MLQLVYNVIASNIVDSSSFGLVINDCISLMQEIPRCTVSHVRRSANHVAHTLARVFGYLSRLGEWYVTPLIYVLE